MVGTCSKCGTKIIRPFPCDSAICPCRSETLVPLAPHVKITLRMRDGRKLREIISKSKIPLVILDKRRGSGGNGEMNESSSHTFGPRGPTYCPKCDSIELIGDRKGYQCLECGFKWKTAEEYAKEWRNHHGVSEGE